MATKKVPKRAGRAKTTRAQNSNSGAATRTSARATVSGPSRSRAGRSGAQNDALVAKMEAPGALAAAMPNNDNKPLEHGKAATQPPRGLTAEPPTPAATGSTLTE